MSYLARYLAGEHEAVWEELSALGEAVRFPGILEDAWEVAAETMRRVYYNLLALQVRLPDCGYQFNAPKLDPPGPVLRAAGAEDSERLRALEHDHGPLPLSLAAFYSVIGEVNFAQDYDQLVQWPDREAGAPYTELETLGEYQPLSIASLAFLTAHRQPQSGSCEVPLLPDEAGNAFYSGDYYYTPLPHSHADASFGTYHGGSERFIDYLRQAFRHSGFHGMPNTDAKPGGERWTYPRLPCIAEIAPDLLPI